MQFLTDLYFSFAKNKDIRKEKEIYDRLKISENTSDSFKKAEPEIGNSKRFNLTKKRMDCLYFLINFFFAYEQGTKREIADVTKSKEYLGFFSFIINLDVITYFLYPYLNRCVFNKYFACLFNSFTLEKEFVQFFNFYVLYDNIIKIYELNIQKFYQTEQFKHVKEDTNLNSNILLPDDYEDFVKFYGWCYEDLKNDQEAIKNKIFEYFGSHLAGYNPVKRELSTVKDLWALNKKKLLNKLNFFFYDSIIFRIFEIFMTKWSYLDIDDLFFEEKLLYQKVIDLIISKSIFQLKIDLTTFLFLGQFVVFYKNLIYDKYIITHKILFKKILSRKLHIYYHHLKFPEKNWRITYECVKSFSNNEYLIYWVNGWCLDYVLFFDRILCRLILKKIYLKNFIFGNLNIFKYLEVLFKALFWQRLRYSVYYELSCGMFEYDSEFWPVKKFEEYYDSIVKWNDEEKLLTQKFSKFMQKNFIDLILPKNKITNYFLLKDFSIFKKWDFSYTFFFFESIFFWKILRFIIIDYCLPLVNIRNISDFNEEADDNDEIAFLSKWFMKFFFFYWTKKFEIKFEKLDFYLSWISRVLPNFNRTNSVFDTIFYSRISSYSLFGKNLSFLFFDQNIFKFDILIGLDTYRDFIFTFMETSLYLNLLYFFSLKLKIKKNYKYIIYFFQKYYIWNYFFKIYVKI